MQCWVCRIIFVHKLHNIYKRQHITLNTWSNQFECLPLPQNGFYVFKTRMREGGEK